ncbi:matrix-remodeling-associated protein 5-like isoform X2 [Halichondria panicea]|uniref:matrix-remodeling-associated protein 5-like isoform X2 n=1 Tax=Halichondria panicea TaxID=6063 RepID=UPI00312B2D29
MNYYFYISLALLAYTTASRAQTVTPERAFAVNNGTVTLSCPADSTSWLRYNGNDLTPVIAGDGVVLRGAELIIEGFHAHTHAGKYYCIATSNGMTTVSCPAEIIHARIQASPFPVNPVDTVVNVNGTTMMTCKPPPSEPAPNIHWKKDGTDLNLQSDARLTVLATGNLYITNTQLTDEGEYQCIAYNEFTGATRRSIIGMLTVSYNLLTPVVPNVTITPANTLIKSLGESAIFECTASGFPPSEIRWEKLHSQIFPSTASVLQSGSLVIDPVTSDEGGVYRCIARNSEGEMYSDVRLEVKGPPDFTEEPSATVAMGDMSSLSWTVQDEGPVKALLFHNGRLLESMSSDSGLSITHALSQSSGGGVYQCIAEGLYGCSQSSIVVNTPQGTTQGPTTTATPQGTTRGPTTTATPQGTTQGPTTTATPQGTTQGPTTTATPQGTTQSPTTTATPQGTTQSPTTTATPQGTTQGPTTTATPQGTTQSSTTKATSSPTESTSTTAETTATTPSATDASTVSATGTSGTDNDIVTIATTISETTQSTTDGLTTSDNFPREMIAAYPDSIELNGPVEIVCVATIGAGVVWYGPSGSVLPSHDVVADLNVMNTTLIVDSPGTYTCRAMWGVLMLSTSVTVTAAPLRVLVSDSLTARVGEPVELLCEGEGSGVGVEWSRVEGSLREGGVVSSSVGQVTSKYQIMAVTVADDGDYVCTVRSPYFEQPLYAIITLTVLDPVVPIGPPLLVTAAVSPSGGVLLSWQPPQTDSKLLGYKINYGNTQYPPTMVARESTAVDKRTFGVRPDIFLEYGEVVTVVVWAYTLQDEGTELRVVVSPAGLVVPTESPTGPPPTDPLPTDLPLIGPPLILVNQLAQDGGVLLSWQPPQTDAKLLGYKINYGNAQNPPIMVARESTDLKTAYFWARPEIFLEYGEDVTVVVWAYTIHDEGAGLRVVVSAVQQIVRSCSVSSAHTLSYTSDHPLTSLTHVCTEAHITQELDHSTANGTVALNNLLPSCSYVFRVTYEDGETVSCDYTTPFDIVDISADVHRHDNGSVSLRWILPVALRNQSQLVVDVNWGNGWVGVVSGEHLPVAIENQKQEFIKLRFTLRDWKGVVFISVPIAPTEITTTFDPTLTSELKATDLALLYGVIFGGLLVLCTVVLVVILSLKYVQSTRRENDKVSDDKEKEREYFRRMSLERVSVNSVKRSAQSLDSRASSTTTETDI